MIYLAWDIANGEDESVALVCELQPDNSIKILNRSIEILPCMCGKSPEPHSHLKSTFGCASCDKYVDNFFSPTENIIEKWNKAVTEERGDFIEGALIED